MLQDEQDRTLRITTLGRFQVACGGRLLSEESKRASKVWELFQYLVTHRGLDIPIDTLIDNLWEEAEPDNPRRALRNLVYRLRQILNPDDAPESAYVVLSRGFYQFNTSVSYWLDTEELEQLTTQVKRLSTVERLENIDLHRRCLSLYKGEYLPGQIYTDWVLPVRNYYRRLYLEIFLDYVTLLKMKDDLAELAAACEQALQVEPLEESIHLEFIDCLLRKGKTKQAQAQYNYASSLFYREMGVKPSPHMVEAYRRITLQNGSSSQTFIQDQLGQPESNGSYACEPDLFRIICKFEKQRLRPQGANMFIANLQLNLDKDERTEKSAAILSDILGETLRQGDTFCHWKPNEFLLLLPVPDEKRVEAIIKRITELYARQCHAKDQPLDSWYQSLHLVKEL